jgi:(p)ppGpp synthase/HD superfamily hydrolase
MVDEQLIERARARAREIHAGDVRKGSELDYFSGHLEPVARIVGSAGGDPAQVAAAYLHDAAEDHGGQATLDGLRAEFGDDVADIVEHLSDTLVADRADKEEWRDRKERYIDQLRRAPIRSVEVAAADKLHNATSVLDDHARIGDELWSRFSTSDPHEHLWYYGSLAALFGDRLGDHPTAVALRRVVAQLETSVRRRP